MASVEAISVPIRLELSGEMKTLIVEVKTVMEDLADKMDGIENRIKKIEDFLQLD